MSPIGLAMPLRSSVVKWTTGPIDQDERGVAGRRAKDELKKRPRGIAIRQGGVEVEERHQPCDRAMILSHSDIRLKMLSGICLMISMIPHQNQGK